MDAIEPNWGALIVFAAVWAVSCIGLFYMIGTLPLTAAPDAVRRGAGPLLVALNVAFLAVLLVSAFLFALAELRWTSLIIAGGMVFLFSPFVVQDLPGRLKDNQLGLVLVLALTVAALAALYFAGAVPSVRGLVMS